MKATIFSTTNQAAVRVNKMKEAFLTPHSQLNELMETLRGIMEAIRKTTGTTSKYGLTNLEEASENIVTILRLISGQPKGYWRTALNSSSPQKKSHTHRLLLEALKKADTLANYHVDAKNPPAVHECYNEKFDIAEGIARLARNAAKDVFGDASPEATKCVRKLAGLQRLFAQALMHNVQSLEKDAKQADAQRACKEREFPVWQNAMLSGWQQLNEKVKAVTPADGRIAEITTLVPFQHPDAGRPDITLVLKARCVQRTTPHSSVKDHIIGPNWAEEIVSGLLNNSDFSGLPTTSERFYPTWSVGPTWLYILCEDGGYVGIGELTATFRIDNVPHFEALLD